MPSSLCSPSPSRAVVFFSFPILPFPRPPTLFQIYIRLDQASFTAYAFADLLASNASRLKTPTDWRRLAYINRINLNQQRLKTWCKKLMIRLIFLLQIIFRSLLPRILMLLWFQGAPWYLFLVWELLTKCLNPSQILSKMTSSKFTFRAQLFIFIWLYL